jgi:BASS family bile acid:Na+ symporter
MLVQRRGPTVTGLLRLFVSLTVFSAMLGLGLGLRSDALQAWCQRPGLPLRLIVGSCVLVPLTAWLLLLLPWSQACSPAARTGLALMAICPSAPLALRRSSRAGGDHQLTALVQVGAALASIVTVPVLGLLMHHTLNSGGGGLHPVDVALQVGRVQVLPLLLGLGLRHGAPRWAERLQAPLGRLATALLLVMVALVLIKAGPLLLGFVPSNLPGMLLMALMTISALAIGRGLAGQERHHQLSGGLVTAMRNPGLALLFAHRHAPELPGLRLAILLYLLVTLLVSIPFVHRHRSAAVLP